MSSKLGGDTEAAAAGAVQGLAFPVTSGFCGGQAREDLSNISLSLSVQRLPL